MQVMILCQILRSLEQIRELRIYLKDDTKSRGMDELVLGPFLALRNTCDVSVSGGCGLEFAEKVQSCLVDAYRKVSHNVESTAGERIVDS